MALGVVKTLLHAIFHFLCPLPKAQMLSHSWAVTSTHREEQEVIVGPGELCWQVLWGQCVHRKHIHVYLIGYFPDRNSALDCHSCLCARREICLPG